MGRAVQAQGGRQAVVVHGLDGRLAGRAALALGAPLAPVLGARREAGGRLLRKVQRESALTQSISQVAPWTIPTYWSMASLLGEPGTPTSAGQHLASPHTDIDGTVAGSGAPGTHLNFKVSR